MTSTPSGRATIDNDFDIEEVKSSGKKGLWTIVLFVVALVVAFVLVKNPFRQGAKIGDTVVVTYTASYDDGTIYKIQGTDTPLTFILGQGQVISGLEKAVLGMKVNTSKTFVVHPKDGFAKYYNPAQKQTLPMILFDKIGEEPVIGKYYNLGNIKGVAIAIEGAGDNQTVILDTNPLYTWQDLHYELSLLELLQQ